MDRQKLTRLGALGLTALLLPLVMLISPANHGRTRDGLVVHEWGTFTSINNKDGQAMTWRPLIVESDLPSFVHSLDHGQSWRGLRYRTKSSMSVRVRMETPVLYFYSHDEIDATVKVGFPGGQITEWYPQAHSTTDGIDWGQIKIIHPSARTLVPTDIKQNHYFAARNTDADVVEVSGEQQTEREKFLFYRGVGNFALPIAPAVRGNEVTIKVSSTQPMGKGILFENRDGQIGFEVLSLDTPEVVSQRPPVGMQLEELEQQLKEILVTEGLYEKEAAAMIATWRNSWFEEGVRLFYIVPRSETDKILPLTITPTPSTTVRVLVGRTELITPEMESNVTAQLQKLNDPSLTVRSAARNEIMRYGRFTEAVVAQVASTSIDATVRTAAGQVLDELGEQTRQH
jgi:hypothetical protein